ncbi:hypothetical protein PVAP13_4KG375802 [Panicum virgatum]|uniref:Uncharacterized protein n=1 Tax=Panicum virgatum TaxID=38727 RepID=A0A8T0TPR6_PANVG|nr:hypothetical protein PVAP13_4KG375802 [Panicum virgatum]
MVVFFVDSRSLRSYVDESVSWFDCIEADTWSPLWFSDFAEQLGYYNNCEVFNSYILEARDLPILSMLERIKCQLMTRHYNKQQEIGEDIQGAFCPKIRKKGCKKCRICKYMLCFTIRTGCVPGADKGLPTHSRYQCYM